MSNYICVTCGVQYPESNQPPEHCPICEDSSSILGWMGKGGPRLPSYRPSIGTLSRKMNPAWWVLPLSQLSP